MADTAASQLPAVPSPGLPAAPGSNPLSRKLNKILETRLDNDKFAHPKKLAWRH
uniref:Uncharacterized protein n=1 Tax=Amazona collaria TaxID=241587 RepID=A0A8B9FSA1_9PSIT